MDDLGGNPLFLDTPISTTFPSLHWFSLIFRISFSNKPTTWLAMPYYGGMKKLSFPPRQGGIVKVNGGWSSGRIHRLVWQILSWATKKNPYFFPLNPGWLIRILIMVYYDPYITG